MRNRTSRARHRKRGAALRPFTVVGALALVLFLAVSAWGITWVGFQPHRLSVRGNHRVSKSRIRIAAALDPNENLWLQSPAALIARVKAIPGIADAWLDRSLPNHATIQVRERLPIARIAAGAAHCVADSTGHLFPALPGDRALPLIELRRMSCTGGVAVRGSTLGRALEVLKAARRARLNFVRLSADRFGGIRALLEDGTLIELGAGGRLNEKLAEVRAVERRLGKGWKGVGALDLRAPSTPVFVEGPKVRVAP